ncbi:efflux RND transporter permease subunit [Nocardiopsis changdeensis]|uniref:efflux RND transporter permease subunit n=1 Tax=Nocardiopsis changdeensis TaxID=2831969 RepID=UPI003F46938D
MRKLALLSLKHRSAVVILSIAALFGCAFAVNGAQRELMPSMEIPMVMVDATYYGASPRAVEDEVTVPLEQAIRSVPDIESFHSVSSEGRSRVTVEFDFGVSSETVLRDVRRATDEAAASLPDGVEVFAQSFSSVDIPVVMLAVSGDSEAGGEQALAPALEQRVVPALEDVEGVRTVIVNGVRERTVTVRVDEEALEEADLTRADVLASLEENGARIPGGPVREDEGEFNVTTGSSLESLEDVENVRVAPREAVTSSGFGGSGPIPDSVPVHEIAEVELETDAASTITRTNGQPSLGVVITKNPDGNVLDISRAVQAGLDEWEDALGDGAEITVVFDQAPQIEESISSVIEEGSVGIAFAVLAVLAFLLSVRSTLVVSVAIPLSILLSLAGTQLLGYSLNLVTLGAIAVTIGRLVDDAIVILENVQRHMTFTEDRMTAVREGTLEVTPAIVSSTLVTLMGFAPFVFVAGMTGEVFRPFALTVSLVLVTSMLAALTVVPTLSYLFVRPGYGFRRRAAEAGVPEPSPLQRGYRSIVRWATAHRVATLAAGAALFIATIGISLSPWLKTDFLGEEGRNTFQAVQELPASLSPEEVDAEAAKVEEALSAAAWVDSYQVTMGGNSVTSALGGGDVGDTVYNITTDPHGDLDTHWDRLGELLAGVDTEYPATLDDGSTDGSSGITVHVGALTPEVAAEAADEVAAALREIDGLENVRTDIEESVVTYEVVVDAEAAADRGLTEGAVGAAVFQAFQGTDVGTARIDGHLRDVVVHVDDQPGTLEEVEDIRVATPDGESVRLASVADIEEVESPPSRGRLDGATSVTVTASPASEDLGSLSTRVDQALDGLDLPEDATVSMGGVTADQDEAFEQMFYAMFAAVMISYVILVVTFRSLVQPLVLLVSVPFAATGSIGLLLITGIPLGVPALIGLLMLIGVVVTNAIVLIDLVNQYRERGMELSEAVVQGSMYRVRPILMTAVATIAALLPLAFQFTDSGGAFMTQPLAIVTIGGLFSSTVLTLVFVPVLYTIVEQRKLRRAARREEKREKRRLKKEAAARTADRSGDGTDSGDSPGGEPENPPRE